MVFTLLPVWSVQAAGIDDANVFLKQPKGSDTCTYFSAAMMLRRRAILDGNSNWSSITGTSVRNVARHPGGGMSNSFTYAGMSVSAGNFSGNAAQKKEKLIAMLNQHPEGVVIYTYGAGKTHAVLATKYENGTVCVADPVYHLPSGNLAITSAWLSGNTQDERIGNLKKYWYVSNGNCNLSKPEPTPVVHTHSWKYAYDSTHPHAKYQYCSCGAKEYTGIYNHLTSCKSCFPLGYVSLTRSFDRTGKTATLYRNNVSNADSYTLYVYKNGYSKSYNMSAKSIDISVGESGMYHAQLTAKNTRTGETRSAECSSFEFLDTYVVAFNANGGTNAPSEQTKVQNQALTLTASVPSRTGYVFKGWSSSKSASDVQYQSGGKYTKNAKITLYAVWEPEVYTIKFDKTDAKGEIDDVTITYGDTMKMPNNIVKEFAYLKGWASSKNAKVPEYKLGLDYKIAGNQTLYPIWGDSTWSGSIASSFSGGDGSRENPYGIASAAELAYLANIVNTQTQAPEYKYYKLTDNINLGYSEWMPIGLSGNANQYFYGEFDGNGYTISDIYMTGAKENNVGLFGNAKNSTIKDLKITGTIESIDTTAAVNVGAIVGLAENTEISECSASYFSVSGLSAGTSDYSNIGMVVGKSIGGGISDCTSNDSSINLKKGNFRAGLIAGYSESDISNCSVKSSEDGLLSTANTIGKLYMGGLCGYLTKTADKCTVNAPYLANEIQTSSESLIGGLCGYTSGTVKVCTVKFTNGKVKTIDNDSYKSSIYAAGTGTKSIGGIAGKMEKSAKIIDCKYDGQSVAGINTSGNDEIGGIAGRVDGEKNTVIKVMGNQSISKGDLPKKEGYKATWYTDSSFANPYDFSKIVDSDITLYAKWEKGTDEMRVWDGTSKEPVYEASTKTYIISTPEELAWISDVADGTITTGNNMPADTAFTGCTVELANDIYLNNPINWRNWETSPPKNEWKPIKQFNGTFNGNNHSINGMHINNESDAALISNGQLGKYLNLTIANSYIIGKTAASICVQSEIYGVSGLIRIENCTNKSTIKGNSAGGLFGCSYRGVELYNCSNFGDVYGENNAGGLICYTMGLHAKNCSNFGDVNSNGSAGGIYSSAGTSTINTCLNNGNIVGKKYVGGIAAYSSVFNGTTTKATIENCHNNGEVTCATTSGYSGGIVGILQACGTIQSCYNSGYIFGNNIGLIAGFATAGVLNTSWHGQNLYIKDSYSFGDYYKSLYNRDTKYSTNYYHISNVGYDYGSATISSLWGRQSDINNGTLYLKSLKDSYITHNVTAVTNTDDYSINRTFSNVDGILFGGIAGGIIGQGTGDNGQTKGLITIADKISGSSASGYIIGTDKNDAFNIENAYYNSDIIANNVTNTTGTARAKAPLKQSSFLTELVGLKPYATLADTENDESAVWVIKNGVLPELYYNCLNDITISGDIEHGKISADKVQAVDGEIVTVTATADENYTLNKIYVNGTEIDGTTFEVSGKSDIYATFSEKTPEYSVKIEQSNNAEAFAVNADEVQPMLLMSAHSAQNSANELTAKDGDEIQVTAVANENYTVDSISVNGEEVPGTSFIVTDDSVVTMKVESLNTTLSALTYDAENVGPYFATLGGTVSDLGGGTTRYIRYWNINEPENVFVTEAEDGAGEYSAEVMLSPETTYQYQMTENGEIKTFTTLEKPVYDEPESEAAPITTTTYKKLSSTYKFNIKADRELLYEPVIVAAYNKAGHCISVRMTSFDGDVEGMVSMPIYSDIDYVCVFVWETFGNMKPYGGKEILQIN